MRGDLVVMRHGGLQSRRRAGRRRTYQRPRFDWEPEVTSSAVESRGARLLLDPLAPPPEARDAWARLQAHRDGRDAMETPLYLPEQRALVFADGMTAPGGELRIWATPWHEERVLPAFRALAELPFERVLVSHGEPVHPRAEFESALLREPWSDSAGA